MFNYDDPEGALRSVHEKFVEFVHAWDELVGMTPRSGRFNASVEAYQPFVRDQGMGDDPFDWMQSAAEELGLEIKWDRVGDYTDKYELVEIVPLEEEEESE
jgi:hypothetical protein